MKRIYYKIQHTDLKTVIFKKLDKEKLSPILDKCYSWIKLLFFIGFPLLVGISLWTATIMCVVVLFEVITTGNKSNIVGLIIQDEHFRGFYYFPVSYVVFFMILWYSKDLFEYADKLYSSQIQQLYFLISVLAALVLLSIDRVWS